MAAAVPVATGWRRKRVRDLEELAGATKQLAAPARPRPARVKKAKHVGTDDSSDDSSGHFSGSRGDMIDDRYEIVQEAGTGTFGRVLLCRDHKHGGHLVAVKAVRRIPKYVEAAKIEASIVSDVNSRDVGGSSLCVRYYRSMEWQQHFFIVTEPLGKSLYDYLKANDFKPLPLYCVQSFADQLLTAVAFLHDMNLVHTDLKPENVLLVKRDRFKHTHSLTCTRDRASVLTPSSTAVRVIDFGGATYDNHRKSSLINTRQYRAPEVILGQGWSFASDIWSIGCILMELYTGRLLFSTHDSHEHLALMEQCLGKFPQQMRTGGNAAKYFHRGTRKLRYWDSPDKESLAHVTRMRKLKFTVHPRDNVFLRFIRSLLEFDPAKRATAAQALNDELFTSVRGFKAPPVAAPPSSARKPLSASSAPSASSSDSASHKPSGSRRAASAVAAADAAGTRPAASASSASTSTVEREEPGVRKRPASPASGDDHGRSRVGAEEPGSLRPQERAAKAKEAQTRHAQASSAATSDTL